MQTMYDTMEQDGAKRFLDSIGRNSASSKTSYSVALTHFQRLLDRQGHDLESIVALVLDKKIDVYDLLDEFVSFLLEEKNGNEDRMSISHNTIKAYLAAVKSYLQYYDIDIIPAKFKRKVKMPKTFREDEEAIDASDIRDIIQHTANRRLKPFELCAASGGLRTIELCSVRLCDIHFDTNPTQIDIRKETKTKTARFTFISDEATKYLKEWIVWRDNKNDTDLVFGSREETSPKGIYARLNEEFNKVLEIVNKATRKEGQQTRKITLNSLRRFVKTTVADAVNSDYSEWLIGHAKSSYWVKKEPEKRQIYLDKCMKYLTFLDYTTLEATGKSTDAKVEGLLSENAALKRQLEDLKNKPNDTETKLNSLIKMMVDYTKTGIMDVEVLSHISGEAPNKLVQDMKALSRNDLEDEEKSKAEGDK